MPVGVLLGFGAAGREAGILALEADDADKAPDGVVLVLNNCDASDGGSEPDNADERINGPEDRKQLTPVRLRSPHRAVKGPTSLRLVNVRASADDDLGATEKVRVFDGDGRAVLGPGRPASYDLSAEVERLATEDLTFYVEGCQFGVGVRLELHHPGGTEALPLEVAPFILVPHTRPVRRNMVSATGWNDDYVKAFSRACREAGVQPFPVAHHDPWIEDELQWGYTRTPRGRLDVALHMYRSSDLADHPTLGREVKRLVLGAAFHAGYFEVLGFKEYDPQGWRTRAPSEHYGGNLEVTPPVAGHPFGRVYFGTRRAGEDDEDGRCDPRRDGAMDAKFRKFFRRQAARRFPGGIQAPVDLCTSWLGVGHVDEVVSFLPGDAGKYGFVLLLASPQRGLDVLTQRDPRTGARGRGWEQQPLPERYRSARVLPSGEHPAVVGDLFDPNVTAVTLPRRWAGDNFEASFLSRGLEDFNLLVHRRIFGSFRDDPRPPRKDSIRVALQEALGLPDEDVREVPALFANEPGTYWSAAALTPGMVNLSSMGRYSLVPDPFLAPFWDDFTSRTLRGTAQKPMPIDDWADYHLELGEVHCGSNALREPPDQKWWLAAGKAGRPGER
jgi:protein-arginine deiminase